MGENLTEIRKLVIEKLKNHNQTKERLAALKRERENFAAITADDMIGSMNFAHGDGSGTSSRGYISDKTFLIAMSYQDEASRLTEDARRQIADEYFSVLQEVERLERFVSLLASDEEQVIRMTFMEHLTNARIADMMGITTRTVRKIRHCALDSLCEMYRFAFSRR